MNSITRKTSHNIEVVRGANRKGVWILLEERKMFQEGVSASHTSLSSIYTYSYNNCGKYRRIRNNFRTQVFLATWISQPERFLCQSHLLSLQPVVVLTHEGTGPGIPLLHLS